MTDAITREEKLLAGIADGNGGEIEPITREEMFLAKLAGQNVETPEPITRREKLLQGIINNGGGGTKVEGTIAITENGTYDVAAYASADVNVESAGGGDIDALIDGSITEITSNAEVIRKSAFYELDKLEKAIFPRAREVKDSAFGYAKALTLVDFHCINIINMNVFVSTKANLNLIIRNTENVVTLKSRYIGFTTPFIYVPRALVEDYKIATNWASYADCFRALEDYTVDGTITGELDESKI